MMNFIKKYKFFLFAIFLLSFPNSLASEDDKKKDHLIRNSENEDDFSLDDKKKDHLIRNFVYDKTLKKEFENYQKKLDDLKNLDFYEKRSRCLHVIYSFMFIVPTFQIKVLEKVNPYITLAATALLYFNNFYIDPAINEIKESPTKTEDFINRKAKVFSENLNITKEKYVRTLLKKYLNGNYEKNEKEINEEGKDN